MLRQLFHYSIHCLKQASHEIEIENWKHSRLDLIIFRKANIICFVYIEFFTRSTEGIENFQISRFEYKSTCTQCNTVSIPQEISPQSSQKSPPTPPGWTTCWASQSRESSRRTSRRRTTLGWSWGTGTT